MDYLIEIFFTILLSVIFLYYYIHDKNGFPSNWPIVGMLPALLLNLHKINDYFTELIGKFNNGQMRDWNYKVEVIRIPVPDVARDFIKINP